MKFITLLILLFPVFHAGNLLPSVKDSSNRLIQIPQQDDTREAAFGILRNKCNTCHITKKRTDVFTKENMEGFAPKIYQQVFVKKKMPKGKKVQLTENEIRILESWVETVLEVKTVPKTEKIR